MVALVALASVVTVAVGTVGGWLLLRRGMPNRTMVPARGAVPVAARSKLGVARQLR
jgi:hypothetical protein